MINSAIEKMAQEMVERYLRIHHPEELSFFFPLWEQVSMVDSPPRPAARGWRKYLKLPRIGLTFDRKKQPELHSVLVILLVKEVIRQLGGTLTLPTLDQVQSCFHETALRIGASNSDATNLASRLGAELQIIFNGLCEQPIPAVPMSDNTQTGEPRLDESNQWVAWLSAPHDMAPTVLHGPCDALESMMRKKKDQYDIIILGRTVNIKKDSAMEYLLMKECEYRLLVMFLKHRGRYLNIFELYRKAWSIKELTHLHDEKLVVDNYLKTAVSALRDHVSSIKSFEIPRKRPGSGYMCMGTFKFAVVLSSIDDKLFTMHPS